MGEGWGKKGDGGAQAFRLPDGKGGIERGTGLDIICCALWDVKDGEGP